MDEDANIPDAGRRAVRSCLVDVLDAAGLRRIKGVSVLAHDAMVARLVDRLAYMTAANLTTLAETCLDNAGGAKHDEWPSEVILRSWAQGLQARPFAEHRIVSSWLASVEGPVAEAGGWLVELYRHLRRRPRPPSSYELQRIRDDARDNHHRVTRIRERMAVDRATVEDQAWLEAYLADTRQARAIVDSGKQGRLANANQVESAAS